MDRRPTQLRQLCIGKIVLPTNLLLAPIAGYTDVSFRVVARRQGAMALGCTDLLSPQGVLRQNFRTRKLMQSCPEDSPLAMQLFGGEDDPLVEATLFLRDAGAQIIDINMGCPVDKIVARSGGSALLCDIPAAIRVVEKVVRAAGDLPVTAKLRLGWDDRELVAPELARGLEDIGVQLITVHGRTRAMQFGGNVRLDGIASVVAAVRKIPVIGNGDIRRPEDALKMIQQTGCAGVMIGRAALAAPWIFSHTWHYLQSGELLPKPSIREICRIIREHFHLHAGYRGEWAAICEFRQRVTWYGKQLNPCRPLRNGMHSIKSVAEFERVLDDFVEWREAGAPDQDVAPSVA